MDYPEYIIKGIEELNVKYADYLNSRTWWLKEENKSVQKFIMTAGSSQGAPMQMGIHDVYGDMPEQLKQDLYTLFGVTE